MFKKINLKVWTAIIVMLLCCPFSLYALPEVDNVAEGEVNIEAPDSTTLNITTLTDKAIINYRQFNIAQNETVRFIQPSVNSSALNRDLSGIASQILGNLFANGSIILINPAGINIGPTANVNVASIIASTLDISNADFLNGNYKFFKNGGNAFLFNQGNIIIRNGGYVALLSQAVENSGKITAELGTVVLASGEAMTLALDDLNEISVVIDEAVKSGVLGFDSAIKNSGTISANGGKVILSAKVLNDVFDYAINNAGVIEANSIENHNGVIELVASGAPIINSGSLIAGEMKVNTDSGFINNNIGKVISDGYEGLPNGGRISIEAATILQQGTISANAFEEGSAGEVSIVSQTSTVLDEGSTTEARALGIVGNGGRILIDSTGGNTTVNTNAVIDVSAGAISGNAGFIEVSAFDQLGFYGVLNGRAPPGFLAADVHLKTNLPFDPSLLDTYALFLSGEIVAENITIFTNQRININVILTAQNTIQVDSQGADISGIFSAEDTIFNMHEGDTNLGEFGPIIQSGNLSETDNGNITVVGNITVTNGTITIRSDNDNDAGGNFMQNAGTVISTTGSNKDITIRSGSGDNSGTGNVTIGTISATGDLKVAAAGGYIRRNSDTTGVTADKLTLKARSIGESGTPLITNIDELKEAKIIAGGAGGIYLNENNGLDIKTLGPNGSETIINNLAGNLLTKEDINTSNGSLTLTSAGNLTIGDNDDDINAGSGDVYLTAGGFITDIADTIIADTLTLAAVNGIGTAANPLNTEVNTLNAETTGDGADIYIDEEDGIDIDTLTTDGSATITANGSSTLGSITTAGNFSFTTSDGAITGLTGTVESLTAGVSLITLGGSIIAIGPGPHLKAAGDSLLEASGVIASLVAPFDVLLTGGDLSVTIGDAIGGISGALSGITPSGAIIVNNAPPGSVYFNGTQIWPAAVIAGGLSGYDLGQYANSLVWRFLLPYLEQLAGYQVNPFTGSVYLYHPLTEADMSAFDEFILEEGAYEFIEGAINIIGHEWLLDFLRRR